MLSKSIPDKGDGPSHVAQEVSDCAHGILFMHRTVDKRTERTYPSHFWVGCYDSCCRDILPRSRGAYERSVSSLSPRTANGRTLREARFVPETEGCSQATPFFRSAGHLVRFHLAMATSSRSLERRSGRWQEKPRRCRRCQTERGR